MSPQPYVAGADGVRRSLSDFPSQGLSGDLLGITNRGHGAYVQTRSVTVGRQDGGWVTEDSHTVTLVEPVTDAHEEFDQTLCVPTGYDAHEPILDLSTVGLSLSEYIAAVADEIGPWQALTDCGRTALQDAGRNPSDCVSE
jgi:hypothetical protein